MPAVPVVPSVLQPPDGFTALIVYSGIMINRNITDDILNALNDTPVVFISGFYRR